jgi:hypothetical protein
MPPPPRTGPPRLPRTSQLKAIADSKAPREPRVPNKEERREASPVIRMHDPGEEHMEVGGEDTMEVSLMEGHHS